MTTEAPADGLTPALALVVRALTLVRSGLAPDALLTEVQAPASHIWPGCRLGLVPGTPPGLLIQGDERRLLVSAGDPLPSDPDFAAGELQAAAALWEVVAEADARGELFRQVLRSNARLARLDDLSRAIGQQVDLPGIVQAAGAALSDLFAVDALGLYLVQGGVPTLAAGFGAGGDFPASLQILGAGGRALLGPSDAEPIPLGESRDAEGAHRLVALLNGAEGLDGLLLARRPDRIGPWDHDAEPLVRAVAGHLATAVRNVQLAAEMRRRATFDDLTGLAGRRHFLTELEREFDRAQRESRPLSVLMVDADHFKDINDHHGHAGGDAALLALADQLRKNIRTLDVAGRLGGEEFAILLPGADRSIAMVVAERLRGGVARMNIPWTKGTIELTVSVGVSTWDRHSDPAQLLDAADQALYRAKTGGRNRVVSHWGTAALAGGD